MLSFWIKAVIYNFQQRFWALAYLFLFIIIFKREKNMKTVWISHFKHSKRRSVQDQKPALRITEFWKEVSKHR